MGSRQAVSKREGVGAVSKRRMALAPNPEKQEEMDSKGESNVGANSAEISKPEEVAGSGEGIIHPLLIPKILEKIFQHIISSKTDDEDDEDEGLSESALPGAKNIHNLRLVCKVWNYEATRLYRRNRAPKMIFGMSCREKRFTYKSPDEALQNFLGVMKSSKLIPIQRYTFIHQFFQMGNQQLMDDFMRICGPEALELNLCWDNSITMKFTRESFPKLNLNALKKLTFHGEVHRKNVTDIDQQMTEIAYLIGAILSAAENLVEFDFSFYSNVDIDGFSQECRRCMAKRFEELISKRIPKTVKILILHLPLNDLHLKTLTESELNLDELGLEPDDQPGSTSSKVIRKLFEKQAATLKVLKIFDVDADRPSPVSFDFPRFDKLLHLEFQGGSIQQFSFPDTFPKLTSLNLFELETESTCEELLSSGKKQLSLKEIHLPCHEPQAPFVKKAAQLFPNITKLHVYPSNDLSKTLQEVFIYFPDIEELYISFRFIWNNMLNADSLFSGVSKRNCRRIKKAGDFDNVTLRDMQHQPSLLDLTKLKKLVITDSDMDVIRTLTDFTAHFVFLKMASLKELQTPKFRMSAKYVDLLREKFTLKMSVDKCRD